MEERLQKILSQCGIASRRKAEEMILQGEVTVNGQIAVLGMKADPERDHIKVRGKILKTVHSKVYLLFNKPERCITSLSDPKKRSTVMDYLRGIKSRVYPVGRLDYNSEGLVLLTNDGELAHAILHPTRKIPKTYLVKIDGVLEDKDILQLKKGMKLEDGITAPATPG
jgi:23S rRNA pseudouridine2605 synthase